MRSPANRFAELIQRLRKPLTYTTPLQFHDDPDFVSRARRSESDIYTRFRKKYNLPVTDPRFLNATLADILMDENELYYVWYNDSYNPDDPSTPDAIRRDRIGKDAYDAELTDNATSTLNNFFSQLTGDKSNG